jgi:antitoxin component of RelBE/YafQ-DinJ toxin-antitoxin module
MRTIQMTLDDDLVKAVDRVSKELHMSRSAFARKALREALARYSMGKTSTIRARIEPDLKGKAEQILEQLGLTTTQAITLFYKQLDEQLIPAGLWA